jgi:hypothetical protein
MIMFYKGAIRLCGVWFHTNFLSLHETSASSSPTSAAGSIASFTKFELERVCRDVKHERYSSNFQAQLYFSSFSSSNAQTPTETSVAPAFPIPSLLVNRMTALNSPILAPAANQGTLILFLIYFHNWYAHDCFAESSTSSTPQGLFPDVSPGTPEEPPPMPEPTPRDSSVWLPPPSMSPPQEQIAAADSTAIFEFERVTQAEDNAVLF